MSLSAPRQLLLPQLLSPQSARGLPWGERVGWRQRPLCHTAANHAAITLCCHPEDWQEGVMSLSGPRGCGKSFMA
ncbi:MAG: hypothetical protein ORN57_01800, partial [Alphaproteobacteria bacterium]|nr:hypothetical protein [Alphaproteobacteria bacterium]